MVFVYTCGHEQKIKEIQWTVAVEGSDVSSPKLKNYINLYLERWKYCKQ